MQLNKIFSFAIGPIGAAALGFITIPMLTWFFTAEDIGKLTMLQVSTSFAMMFFSLGLHQSYVREYHEEKDKPALLKMAMLPGGALLVFVITALTVFDVPVSKMIFGVESIFVTSIFYIAILASYASNFLVHVIRMQERGLAFSVSKIFPKLVFLLFISGLLLLSQKLNFRHLLALHAVSLVLSLCMFLWLTRAEFFAAVVAKIDAHKIKQMLSFGLPLVLGSLAYWALTTMDRFFLISLSGFDELGIYAVAVNFAGAATVFSSIFSSLWHPTVYKWIKQGVDPKKVQAVIDNTFLAIAALWSLAGLFAWLVLFILPAEYAEVEKLLIACMCMPLFYILSETTVVGIGITRRTWFALLPSVLALLVNAALNYMLIPAFGAAGAAAASAIAFFVFFIVRTEASAFLWVSFARAKIYMMTFLYLAVSVAFLLVDLERSYFLFAWVLLLLISGLLYLHNIKSIVIYLPNYLNLRKGKQC